MSDGGPREWDGARYDRVAGPQTRWGETVLQRLPLAGDETVLDAGCGSGRVTQMLLDRLPRGRVIALDASESMLAQARERLGPASGRVRFVHGDLRELGPDLLGEARRVDAVLSTATFHWVTDHDRLFRNLASVLRRGGQLAAQCGGRGNIDSVIRAAQALGVPSVGTWVYASPEETSERLARAGFADIRTWSHPEPTPFPPGAPLVDFLETAILREHLATLPPGRRHAFARQVADAMPEPVIDYVRLNIAASRA